jgi:hypothetical protein
MRATTPADQLGKIRPTPLPKFKVGDKVFYCPPDRKGDRGYYLKLYTRHLIQKFRRFERPGRLHEVLKNQIRTLVTLLHDSYQKEVEIAGIIPHNMYIIDSCTFNECYHAGVSGASAGTYYDYQILIRWTDEAGRHLANITGIPVGPDYYFKEAL